MNYFEYNFTVIPPEPGSDILISMIADLGFESFEINDKGFLAYIPEQLSTQLNLSEIVFSDFTFSYSSQKIEQINWNEEWEKNFKPVIVNEQCCIRAPFHELEKKYTHEIVIMPKMSFGTGHHDTTWLVCKNMLEFDFKNKIVFDMGCGTGILSILAKKLGAEAVIGNDIDEWSVENSKENCNNNACPEIEIIEGNGNIFSLLHRFDIILANINKNVIKTYFPSLSEIIKPEGVLFLSGFFKTDCDDLIDLASDNSFTLLKQEVKNEWANLILKRNK